MFKRGKEYHIAWVGSEQPTDGYGSSNLNILKVLAGTSVRAHRIDSPEGKECTVGVGYTPLVAEPLALLPTPYRILLTMFEADEWPKHWVTAANCVNQVWVPSTFCREWLIRSGCEAPVYVVPFGIDPTVYYLMARPKEAEGGTFTFGFAGAASPRKGFDALIQAFQTEFAGDDPVRLAIHTTAILSSRIPKDERIVLSTAPRTPDEMREFYNTIDCFVMPTYGEGFGLTPLEAMGCGCCAAVTDWSGCKDYLGDYTLRIASDGLVDVAGYHGSGGQWARPNMQSLQYCMRWAYEHRAECRKMGTAAAKVVAKTWTWAHTAQVIEGLIHKVKSSERVEVEPYEVVVWQGDPRNIITKYGGFRRNVPRQIKSEQAEQLSHDRRFTVEPRYKRIASPAD